MKIYIIPLLVGIISGMLTRKFQAEKKTKQMAATLIGSSIFILVYIILTNNFMRG